MYTLNMTLWRTFKKISVITLAIITSSTTFLSAPAYSAGLEADFSGVALPSGASITLDRATFEYGGTLLYITIKSPGAPANSVLKLQNFKVSGLPDGAESSVLGIYYYQINDQYPNFNFLLTNKDLTQSNIKVTFTGTGTYEKNSDLAYPKSYSGTFSNLDALGIEVTDGYNVYSSEGRYGFYISIKTKADVAPFSIVIGKSELRGKSFAPVALSHPERVFEVTATPTEIFLGESTTDPTINMTDVAITVTFRKYIPSTTRQIVTAPENLEVVRLTQISYFEEGKKSYIGVVVKNTSDKPINVDGRALVISDESSGSAKKISGIDAQTSLATIQPTIDDSESNYYQFSFAVPLDLRENMKLAVSGALKTVSPSIINTKKVRLPKGFTLKGTDFSHFSYDPLKNQTQIWVSVTKPTDSNVVLKISGVSISSGKASPTLTYAPYFYDQAKNQSRYLFDLGSISGDARVGKKITLAATLTAVKKTTFTHTATLDPAITDIYLESYSVYLPEYWKYDKKTNTTSVIAAFQKYGLKGSRSVYLCSLSIVADGKTVAAPQEPILVKPDTYPDYDSYTIAKLTGDFRAGGHTVTISGRYSASGC